MVMEMYNYKSIILLIFLVHCVPARRRIIGGYYPELGKFPYLAALILQIYNSDVKNSTLFCGGSLITTKYVLTAAHCLLNCWLAKIGLGVITSFDISQSGIVMESTKLRPHNKFQPIGKYDVGLVELPKSVQLSDNIRTIKLPLKTETDTYINRRAIVSGWGKIIPTEESTSGSLKMLDVVVVSTQECAHFVFHPGEMLCGKGAGGGRTCQGDSGGPLVVTSSDKSTLIQIGIVSFGDIGCLEGVPTVYTRVTYYLDWIEKNSDYVFE